MKPEVGIEPCYQTFTLKTTREKKEMDKMNVSEVDFLSTNWVLKIAQIGEFVLLSDVIICTKITSTTCVICLLQ